MSGTALAVACLCIVVGLFGIVCSILEGIDRMKGRKQ